MDGNLSDWLLGIRVMFSSVCTSTFDFFCWCILFTCILLSCKSSFYSLYSPSWHISTEEILVCALPCLLKVQSENWNFNFFKVSPSELLILIFISKKCSYVKVPENCFIELSWYHAAELIYTGPAPYHPVHFGGSSSFLFANSRRLLLLIFGVSHNPVVASRPFCLCSSVCACLSDCMWYVCNVCTWMCAGVAHSWCTEEVRGRRWCPGPWLSTYSFENGSLT